MSGPELRRSSAAGIALAACPLDIVELAAFRERTPDLERLAAAWDIALPAPGGIVARAGQATLSVRPGRWLLLTAPAAAGASAARWQEASGGRGAVVDLSSALAAFLLTGPAVGAVLARGCRLDLDAGTFPAGHAAATIMVQVPAILARLTAGMLLLTPATTARHLREWLVATAEPFGLARLPDATVSDLWGEKAT